VLVSCPLYSCFHFRSFPSCVTWAVLAAKNFTVSSLGRFSLPLHTPFLPPGNFPSLRVYREGTNRTLTSELEWTNWITQALFLPVLVFRNYPIVNHPMEETVLERSHDLWDLDLDLSVLPGNDPNTSRIQRPVFMLSMNSEWYFCTDSQVMGLTSCHHPHSHHSPTFPLL
jgi:hypothetical protein